MSTRLYILAASALAIAAPLHAQPAAAPDDKGVDKQATIAVRELEQKIGGRTTLQLKFEGLTAEDASAALAKSSGLRFGPPLESPFGRVVSVGPANTGAAGQPEVPRYNADVAKADFWPGMRAWSRAEAARMKREREALQRRQSEEKPPPMPTAEPGQEVAPEAMAAWQAQQNEWYQRRSQQMHHFDLNRGVSARFDAGTQTWSLGPGDQIATGRAFNAWPCLVLATGFGRNQNLSIEEAEAQEKAPEKAGDKAASVAARVSNGSERVEGGQLYDSLSLGLTLYLEPKLLERAKLQLRMDEARDDAGEDLLPEREKGAPAAAQMLLGSGAYGGPSSGMTSQVPLRPRQSRGKKLAVLRGVVSIRYPMQVEPHEITDFSGPQGFGVGMAGLPAAAQLEPPRMENGQWTFKSSVTLSSETGYANESQRPGRIRGGRGTWGGGDLYVGGVRADLLLPDRITFTDAQGRTWRARGTAGRVSMVGPSGPIVPATSPPTPPPDNFTYTEERTGTLQLMPEGGPPRVTTTPSILHITGEATYISQVTAGNSGQPSQLSQPGQLSPEEMAKVKFVKATFTTESDWRTIEVPFEFRDLPLPPR